MSERRKKPTAAQQRAWIDYNFKFLIENIQDLPFVLGLDFSLTSTGYVVLDSKTGEMVRHGTVQTGTKDGTVLERLGKIRAEFEDIVNGLQMSILGYEMVSVGTNLQAMAKLAMVQSQMYGVLANTNEVPPYVISIAATSLKKAALGSGKGDKNLMLKAVYKNWKQDFQSDDEADAYVAARVAFELTKIAKFYQELRKDVADEDMNAFLISLEKSRHEGMNQMIEEAGISQALYEVALGLMKSQTQAKENDYGFYQAARKEILG